MPRVTQRDQYKRHQHLRRIWNDPHWQSIFGALKPYQQQQIHLFYRPDEPLDFAEFKEQLRAERPELVHVVGKLWPVFVDKNAYQAAVASLPGAPLPTQGRKGKKARNIIVTGIARPQPDLRKLALAAVMLAEEDRKARAQEAQDEK